MGFEPTCNGFAIRCLTTWLPHRTHRTWPLRGPEHSHSRPRWQRHFFSGAPGLLGLASRWLGSIHPMACPRESAARVDPCHGMASRVSGSGRSMPWHGLTSRRLGSIHPMAWPRESAARVDPCRGMASPVSGSGRSMPWHGLTSQGARVNPCRAMASCMPWDGMASPRDGPGDAAAWGDPFARPRGGIPHHGLTHAARRPHPSGGKAAVLRPVPPGMRAHGPGPRALA